MRVRTYLLWFLAVVIVFSGCKKEVDEDQEIMTEPKTELIVKGGDAVILKGRDAGLPLESLPGVKSITFKAWLQLEDVPETGLFLVDTDYIPHGLKDQLKREKLTLMKDGTLLDSAGTKTTVFTQAEMFKVVEKKQANMNPKLLEKLADLFAKPAIAGDPYPFSAFSWNMWWRYRGGFCRDYRAWTVAEAWGPLQGGARPHTRIEYIETRVRLHGNTDRDDCGNCDYESSYRRYKIGCFWPAHGGANLLEKSCAAMNGRT